MEIVTGHWQHRQVVTRHRTIQRGKHTTQRAGTRNRRHREPKEKKFNVLLKLISVGESSSNIYKSRKREINPEKQTM